MKLTFPLFRLLPITGVFSFATQKAADQSGAAAPKKEKSDYKKIIESAMAKADGLFTICRNNYDVHFDMPDQETR